VHWYFLFAAFWACIGTALRRRRLVLDTTVVVLAALTDPLAVLFLPLAIVRATREKARAWILAGLVTALTLQYLLAFRRSSLQHGHRRFEDLPLIYCARVIDNFLLGDAASRRLYDQHSNLVVLLPAAVVVAGFAVALVLARGSQRRLLAVLLGYSVAFFVASLTLRGGTALYLRRPTTLPGSRYMIVPLWFLYSALIVAAGMWPRSRSEPSRATDAGGRSPRLQRAFLPVAAVGLIVVQLVANFAPTGSRTSGTSWRLEIAEARQACRSGVLGVPVSGPLAPQTAPVLIRPGVVAVPVAPYGRLFWAARLYCRDVTAG
jgi:hypothetical protein